MGHQTVIEINGRQYNAETGELIGISRIKAVVSNGRDVRPIVSDVTKRRNRDEVLVLGNALSSQVITPAHQRSMEGVRQIHHLQHHTPQHSKTLVRKAVKKPDYQMKPKITKVKVTEVAAKTAQEVAKPLQKKVSVSQIHPARMLHAKSVHKSHHIQRFSKSDRSVAVVAAHHAHQKAAVQVHSSAHAKGHTSEATKLFEQAMSKAAVHHSSDVTRHRRHLRHDRMKSALAGIAAILVVGSFITYLNMPKIELQVASAKAGFRVNNPAYSPDNSYSLANGITASKNKVEMTYASGKSSYKITQSTSDLSSTALLAQLRSTKGDPDRIISDSGRTVYYYHDSSSWVSGGVQYTLDNNANLSSVDVARIASSI